MVGTSHVQELPWYIATAPAQAQAQLDSSLTRAAALCCFRTRPLCFQTLS